MTSLFSLQGKGFQVEPKILRLLVPKPVGGWWSGLQKQAQMPVWLLPQNQSPTNQNELPGMSSGCGS